MRESLVVLTLFGELLDDWRVKFEAVSLKLECPLLFIHRHGRPYQWLDDNTVG